MNPLVGYIAGIVGEKEDIISTRVKLDGIEFTN